MRTATLGAVAEIVSGATPKTGTAEFWDGDVNWATPADLSKLSGPYISVTPRRITAAGVRSCGTTILPPNSVLLSSRAPIGHVAINTVPMATNQGFKSLVPGPDLDAKYLYHWLKANTAFLQSLGNGATFKEISKRTTEGIEIPLPDVAEQRQIAAILDQADAIRAKRRQVLTHLDALTQSTFYAMFGDPLDPKVEGTRRSIGSLATVVTGNSPAGSDPANFGRHVEWIKSGNLGGDVATVAEQWLSELGSVSARLAASGSVLVTCIAGSSSSIGKASLVDRPVAFNQQINAVLPSDALDNQFLLAQLKVAPDLVRRRSSGGMKGLVSKSAFKSIEILCPPIAAQREFAAHASAISQARIGVERALAADDELFASLQSSAFRGKL